MFEEMDNYFKKNGEELKNREKNGKIKEKMINSLPYINNILHPSTSSLATMTRIQVEELKDELKAWKIKNKALNANGQKVFNEFLEKFKSINERVINLNKKSKPQRIIL